jgi:hypothetical protein
MIASGRRLGYLGRDMSAKDMSEAVRAEPEDGRGPA